MKSQLKLFILGITLLLGTSCSTTKFTSEMSDWVIDETNHNNSTFIHTKKQIYQIDSIHLIENGTYTLNTIELESQALELYDSIKTNRKYNFKSIDEKNLAFQSHIFIDSITILENPGVIQFKQSNIIKRDEYKPARADSAEVKSNAKLALDITGAAAGTLGGIGLFWLYLRSLVN